jgi:hypothetical protein
MITQFNDDLSKLEIYAHGAELATVMGMDKDSKGNRVHTWPEHMRRHVVTFENPTLVTDNHKISLLEPTLRDTVFALYSSPIRITEYKGTTIRYDAKKYGGVWGPSIDTLLFCRALEQTDLSQVRKAAEVGPASGLISKRELEKSPALDKLYMIDIDPISGLCIADNIKDPRAEFIHGDGLVLTANNQYDLVMCNPPYIIRPKSIDDNPFEGIGLLVNLIKRAPQMLTPNGKMIINISSLSGQMPHEMIRQAGVNARVLDEMTVPLKVYNVLNNKEWTDYLLGHGLMEKKRRDGYDYWQNIKIYEITANRRSSLYSH